ncbi:MAG: DUF6263 family protein [bacterium]
MTKQRMITLLSLIIMLPAMILPLQAQKSVELKYNLQKGNIFDYSIVSDQDIVFEANGQTMAMDNSFSFYMTQEISEVTADSIRIEGKINRTVTEASIFGMTVTYDSDDPASTQNPMSAKMGEEFMKILNKPFSMSMDHRGNMGNMDISNLSDNDEIAKNINSGSQFAVYPKGKITIGDSWTKQIMPVEGSDMKFDATYTLLKLSGKQATIGIEGTITSNTMDGEEMKIDGTMKGEMLVDVKTGWLIESTLNQELQLDLEQNGAQFPATITGTTVTTSAMKN